MSGSETAGYRRRDFLSGAVALAAGGILSGCTDTGPDPAPVISNGSHWTPGPSTTARESAPPPVAKQPPAPAKIRADELGLVPVLMYHRLVRSGAGEYDMTPAFFRSLLERLYRERYHPVRTIDLVRGNLGSVPAGKSPVVLTFDDSTPGQVAFDARGRVRPDCALGIMLDFHAVHPDFPAVGSFYLNQNPFGLTGKQVPRAVAALHELGCEVGNHTLNHPNLRQLGDDEIERELGGVAAMVGPAVRPLTLALPFGVPPRDREVLTSGGSGRTAYRNEGVLLVGANPAVSPFHREFDPLAIPRIRCSSHAGGRGPLEVHHWLDRLKKPQQRYVAAGNPDRITAPRARAAELNPVLRKRATWYNPSDRGA